MKAILKLFSSIILLILGITGSIYLLVNTFTSRDFLSLLGYTSIVVFTIIFLILSIILMTIAIEEL